MSREAFFRDELPCTYGGEVPAAFVGNGGIWQHLLVNDLRVINNHFRKANQFAKYRRKYVNGSYRWQDNIRTLVLEKLFPEAFLGFKNLHAPAAFLKSTFETLWEKEPGLLHQTCGNRFRSNEDVNQWLAQWWQIADGQFVPYMVDNVVEDVTEETVELLCATIRDRSHDMVCVNDPSDQVDFATLSAQLKAAFEAILPEKSGFER